jgi:GTPase SAR1 family protein
MTTTNSNANYEAFLEKRNTLISMIDRQITLSASLNIDTWVETLHRLKNRVSNESFKVLIIGEFKRGKSTFINAMLGQDILPAYSTPCTAIINEVKWGQSPQALLHYLKHEDGSQKEPKEIPVEAIEEYVVIPEEPDESYVNPYEKVEILYPLELCRSGVEVIDSPGLNEHATRSQVTEDYLPTVDAIVFVFTCEALASQSEIRFIENNLRPLGHDDLFFVCNKFDQIRDKEKERVRKFAVGKLSSLTSQGENGVFFISAFNALEGRLNGDNERLEKSGVLILERELEKFLTNDRGRLKILEPAKDLQEAIKVAKQIVPERKAMLQTSREELERRRDTLIKQYRTKDKYNQLRKWCMRVADAKYRAL